MRALAALGWVIAVLTGSVTKVSLVAFAMIIPLVVLSPVAGSLTEPACPRAADLQAVTRLGW